MEVRLQLDYVRKFYPVAVHKRLRGKQDAEGLRRGVSPTQDEDVHVSPPRSTAFFSIDGGLMALGALPPPL